MEHAARQDEQVKDGVAVPVPLRLPDEEDHAGGVRDAARQQEQHEQSAISPADRIKRDERTPARDEVTGIGERSELVQVDRREDRADEADAPHDAERGPGEPRVGLPQAGEGDGRIGARNEEVDVTCMTFLLRMSFSVFGMSPWYTLEMV